MKSLKSNLLLMLAAIIWGSSFVAQSVGVGYVGPFTFNGVRFIIGGIVLLPVIALRSKTSPSSPSKHHTLKYGMICGIILVIASSLQQVGIIYTTAGKSGFITALYVILVPFIGLFLGKRSTAMLWISAVLAVGGMYLLCLSESMTINKGDVLTLICAVCFSFHILAVDTFGPHVDGVRLSCTQFFTAGIISMIIAIATEDIALSAILSAYIPLLYSGVMSCGVAYTLQIIGQKNTSPVIASIILSLESVFAVITAWIILGDSLTIRELLGCVIMFAAIVLAQLPSHHKETVNG